MKKIAVALATAVALAIPAGTQAAQAVPADRGDVRLMKTITVRAFYHQSPRSQSAICWGWEHMPWTALDTLSQAGIDNGISRHDARKGVRKALNKVCY